MSLRDDLRTFTQAAPKAPLAVPTPELPQWDGKIFCRALSSDAIVNHWRDGGEDADANDRTRFFVLAAGDEAGNRVFVDEDALWLGQSAFWTPIVERFCWAARHHNGLTDENRSAWRKNSPGTAAAGLPSS